MTHFLPFRRGYYAARTGPARADDGESDRWRLYQGGNDTVNRKNCRSIRKTGTWGKSRLQPGPRIRARAWSGAPQVQVTIPQRATKPLRYCAGWTEGPAVGFTQLKPMACGPTTSLANARTSSNSRSGSSIPPPSATTWVYPTSRPWAGMHSEGCTDVRSRLHSNARAPLLRIRPLLRLDLALSLHATNGQVENREGANHSDRRSV